MVIRLAFPPSIGTVQISPWYEKATDEPSGLSAGNLAKVEKSVAMADIVNAKYKKIKPIFFMILKYRFKV